MFSVLNITVMLMMIMAQCIFAAAKSIPSAYLPGEDICGTGTEAKIYGGNVTELDEFPWLALLQYKEINGRHFQCGGVLISERYVLTAAHCILDQLVSVKLGEYNTSTEIDCVQYETGDDCAPAAINITVEEKIVHENYTANRHLYNDIALLRLKEKVTFSDFIKPICLPTTTQDLSKTANQTYFVAGWGRTENASFSNVKLKVNLPVNEFSNCRITYRTLGINLKDGQMCAGGERGHDSCVGDSGGPLMTSINKNGDVHWHAVGLVSMGPNTCGLARWPGVYTKISSYIEWIAGKLKP